VGDVTKHNAGVYMGTIRDFLCLDFFCLSRH